MRQIVVMKATISHLDTVSYENPAVLPWNATELCIRSAAVITPQVKLHSYNHTELR